MREYILKYRDFGKDYYLTIPAHGITEAMDKGKEYLESNFITFGWIISPHGKKYLI